MKHERERAVKEKRRLAHKITLELLGPIVGKMPKSSIESLEKLSYLPKVKRHIAEIISVADAHVVKHDLQVPFPPFIRTEAAFGKRNIYLLKDAVVSPDTGMAWIGNRIIEESVGSLRRIMDWGDMLHEPLLPVSELRSEDPIVVCHPAAGYYHWLLEVLPNLLYAVSTVPQVKIVLPENCPAYVMDGLATVLGPEAAGRFIFCSTPLKVRSLVMPQYHTAPEFTSPQVIDLLRSQVKAKVIAKECSAVPAPGTRLYISRRRSRRRRLMGEEELERTLKEKGFTILHLEDFSFQEQIRIFRQAETVVATHGAGLSNLVWSDPPCRVIEIFPRNYVLDCFAWLSFCLGFDYRHVICSTGHRIDDEAMAAVLEQL
ncbi:Capsular polysaccharide biosynthesis protein-like protein [Citrifermentans bremense]|uniref:Capsular polysaccharide biosynthesis protein-like protein n=1 Tax=Citrifermentans bremense TaxID=60035 RepID=A0A6S6LUN9_9BACT|nr:glycosyltransferase family 61 protein [Citrifermentans bremense]BCG45677.1 Capsular polysaccharide biosynthesis protein-like protein [Citrifermentans bremense]